MNPHFQKALGIYGKHGINFEKLIGWHLCHGIVVCNPDVFAMAYHTDSRDLPAAVQFHHSDTLFVTFFTGNMRHGLRPYLDCYEFIAFQRDFKNSPRVRLIEMREFYSKIT